MPGCTQNGQYQFIVDKFLINFLNFAQKAALVEKRRQCRRQGKATNTNQWPDQIFFLLKKMIFVLIIFCCIIVNFLEAFPAREGKFL